ncbi:MAG: hypothetical protein JWQ07_5456 [Ramlibacter sp.]|nr:hypothetical protein [Ramlibacter sp.]
MVISKSWAYLSVVVLVTTFLCLSMPRAGQLSDFVHGAHGTHSISVFAWLVGLVVALIAALAASRSLSAARRELHRHSQLLAAAASTSHDWLWETDLDNLITYSSDGVEALLG